MSSKSKHKRLQMKRKIKHRQKKKVLRRELSARRAEAAKE